MKIVSKIDSSMTVSDIFAEINKRQITGMMFHREMAVLFSFLGLQGFKRLQQYRYKEESDENIKMQFYYIDYCNHLIPELDLDIVQVIPKDWYKVDRLTVNGNVKKSYTERAFTEWQEWEKDTKEVLEKYYKILIDAGHICAADYISCILNDVIKELKKLERCIEDMRLVDYDPVYLAEIQKKMHDKYKKKMRID